jgi:hypothetical protein
MNKRNDSISSLERESDPLLDHAVVYSKRDRYYRVARIRGFAFLHMSRSKWDYAWGVSVCIRSQRKHTIL